MICIGRIDATLRHGLAIGLLLHLPAGAAVAQTAPSMPPATEKARAPTTVATATGNAPAATEAELQDLRRRHLEAQIKKLEVEVESLQNQTPGAELFRVQIEKLRAELETLDSQRSGGLFATGLIGAGGGLMAALIAGVVTVIGYRLNENVRRATDLPRLPGAAPRPLPLGE